MNRQKNPRDCLKPTLLFSVSIGAIFVIELLLMFSLRQLPTFSAFGQASLDACLLTLFVSPFLYYFLCKPLRDNIQARLTNELERDRLTTADYMKSEFISIAAHELRTPLTSIMGYSEILLSENGLDTASRREYASIIHKKSDTMERLIDDLLDLSRIDLGQPLRTEKGTYDIIALLRGLFNDLQKKHPLRKFELLLKERQLFFHFDQVRIEQALDNLLNNALKFSSSGSDIEIEAMRQNTEFAIQISDRGIGMSPAEQGQIFDKFYRVNTSNTSPAGLGLGMVIVKEIVDAHQGRIWLKSTPGEGTTINISLPITT